MGARRYVVRRQDFRDEYNAGTLYPTGSIVRYQGSMWRTLRPVQGIAPVEGADWTLMVEKGATGPRGGVLYGARAPQSGDGVDGEFWINTDTDFIFGPKADGAWPTGNSLVGPTGPSAYEAWLDAGNNGTETDFLADLEGEIGPSAYAAWLGEGNQGTEADFLADIKGEKGDPGAINRIRVGGSDQPQRGALNFAAPYFAGTDDSANGETEVTLENAVSGGASGLLSGADKAKLNDLVKTSPEIAGSGVTSDPLKLRVYGYSMANGSGISDVSVSNGVDKKVLFPTVTRDPDNCFSSSRYTCKKTGVYPFAINVALKDLASGTIIVYLAKNGSRAAGLDAVRTNVNGTFEDPGGTRHIFLQVDDYLEVFVKMAGGSGTIRQELATYLSIGYWGAT